MGQRLPVEFYTRGDVVEIARDLLGKVLVTNTAGALCKAVITETEAYNGRTDRACHAYGGRLTERTRVMYRTGGIAYVYLCYGIHNLFNIVTNREGLADAVLIRAVQPMEGIETMLRRRNMTAAKPTLSAGPGSLTQALGIDRTHNGISLVSDQIWLEEGPVVSNSDVITGLRVGIDYAGSDALLPWRFILKNP